MMIKLDLYRIFYEVGKYASFSKAAEALYLTQPAVSQSIRQLEEQLEVRLFNRTTKGVHLTKEGELLYEYAQSAIHLLEAGERKLDELKGVAYGELAIGVGDAISRYYLMPYLAQFHRLYPNIKFRLENGTTNELRQLLKQGDLDIALCNLPIEDEQLAIVPTFDVQDVFVYGEKYQKLLEGVVTYEQLAKLPLIMLEGKSNSRQYVESYLKLKGVDIEPEFELGSHDLLLQFAKTNFGVAAVTREFATEYFREGSLREVQLEEPIPQRQIGICYLNTVALSPAAERFYNIVIHPVS